jgi:hypothetical protein|tara:strand:+ start:1753 stop:2253 length:501 start_codon:yes stop_codon:yes gene_type:complete
VTGAFNQLVYQYPIRIPERFSLVIRSLLTQEGICMTLSPGTYPGFPKSKHCFHTYKIDTSSTLPDFRFLEVAYPYVAKRLLTDRDASLRTRLTQVLFSKDGTFQWARLENLVTLARTSDPKGGQGGQGKGGGLDLTDTVADGAQLFLTDPGLRKQVRLYFPNPNTV